MIVAAGMVLDRGRLLLTQRKEDAHQPLLWEFPGGKVEEGEAPKKALQRELREELRIEVEVGRIFEVTFHTYPEHHVLLLFYPCRIREGVPQPIGCRDLRWFSLGEMNALPMPAADDALRKRLHSLEEVDLFF